MMEIISGFIYIMLGVFFVWMGSFQLITAMLPHDIAMKAAEAHGSWMRENVFRLPPAKG